MKIKSKFIEMFLIFIMIITYTYPVFAEEETDGENIVAKENIQNETSEEIQEESSLNNGFTNTFYTPKSRFRSDYEYEKYCERMYNQGYMDEDYQWTPQAKTFINNMTEKNYNTLDKAARELVEERIENGDMKKSDSPYLTYEERQEALAEEAAMQESSGSPTPQSEDFDDLDDNKDLDDSEEDMEMDPIEKEAPTSEPEPDSGSMVRLMIFAVIAIIVAIGAYIVYRRQF